MLLQVLFCLLRSLAYFGNSPFPYWQVKTRQHRNSFMFEVKCTQLYVLTLFKRRHLVIHLILSKECLCVSLLCLGWVGIVKMVETPRCTQGLEIKQQKPCGDMSSFLSPRSKFMIVVLFGV